MMSNVTRNWLKSKPTFSTCVNKTILSANINCQDFHAASKKINDLHCHNAFFTNN